MQAIDIRTSQNVVIEYELASLRERMLAFFIDFVIVVAMYILVFLSLMGMLQDAFEQSSLLLYFVGVLLPIGGFMLYQLLSEVLAGGQSWGKKSMGIKVVRLDGQEPGLSDYLLRAVFHIVDSLASLGVIGALMISSSNKNQRLGDMTANTTVIRVQHNLRFKLSDILKINSLEDYEPQYPEVKKLGEQDMLLIKGIITRYRSFQNAAHEEVVNTLIDRISNELNIKKPARQDRIEFLKTLIRDYIVLTR
jgi:uncharacterized RDD family membrane protein YckC